MAHRSTNLDFTVRRKRTASGTFIVRLMREIARIVSAVTMIMVITVLAVISYQIFGRDIPVLEVLSDVAGAAQFLIGNLIQP